MDSEISQLNGEECNGSENGVHPENGANGVHEEDNVDQSDIAVLKEKARQSLGEEVQVLSDTEESGPSAGNTDEVEESAAEDEAKMDENREEALDADGNLQSKVEEDVPESEDIMEHRDSDEPAENEEAPGKMMAVSCDSIDVMSTTAEDGSEGQGEEVQSPGSNDSQQTDKSQETTETLNGDESLEVEQVIEEVDQLMVEAGDEDLRSEDDVVTIEGATQDESEDTGPLQLESPTEEILSPEPSADEGMVADEEDAIEKVEEPAVESVLDTQKSEDEQAVPHILVSDSEEGAQDEASSAVVDEGILVADEGVDTPAIVVDDCDQADVRHSLDAEGITVDEDKPIDSEQEETAPEKSVEAVEESEVNEERDEAKEEIFLQGNEEDNCAEEVSAETQEIEDQPVVQDETVDHTGTITEEQTTAAGGSQEEEMHTEFKVSEDVEVSPEAGLVAADIEATSPVEEHHNVEETFETNTPETDHSNEETAEQSAESQMTLKEDEVSEEKEQESLGDGELGTAEEEVSDVQPEVVPECHTGEAVHDEEPAVEETIPENVETDEASIKVQEEPSATLEEHEQTVEESEQGVLEAENMHAEMDSEIEVQSSEVTFESENHETEGNVDADSEPRGVDNVVGATENESESKEEEDNMEMQDEFDEQRQQRRLSAQERFGLPAPLSSSESLSAVLQEEELGSASSDNGSATGSATGSPRLKKKSRRRKVSADVEGPGMEEVENTVRKMSVGSSKVWYKDLFNMTRSEVDKTAAEEPQEDDLQNLPSLKNIKSRFESRDDGPKKEVKEPGKLKASWGTSDMRQKEVSPSPPRDPDIFRETKDQQQEEVLVNYGGLGSIRSRYIESTTPVQPSQGPPPPKAIPRSDEPVHKSPSVSPPREVGVIRSDEPRDETEELPPQNITRGLLARFRQMEEDHGKQASVPAPANNRNVHAKSAKTQERSESPAPADTNLGWERIDRTHGQKNGVEKQKPNQLDTENMSVPKPVERSIREENLTECEFPLSPIHVLASRYGTSVRSSPKSSSAQSEKKTPKVWTPPPLKAETPVNPNKPKHMRSPIKTCPAPRTDLIEADLQPTTEHAPEAGEFENQPSYRDDVVREDDDHETQHLPSSGNLKNRLALFKQMENTNVSPASVSFGNQYGSNRQSPSRMNGTPGNYSTEVLREGEGNPEEELPPSGAAKNMREKFQSMQQQEGSAGGDKKPTARSQKLLNSNSPQFKEGGHRFTPPRGSPDKQLPEVESADPQHDPDVIRSDVPMKDILPSQKNMNSCLTHFRQMEVQSNEEKTREYSPGPKTTNNRTLFVTEFHPGQSDNSPPKPPRTVSNTPGSASDKVYNPSWPEGGEYENQPITRTDVVRETDYNEEPELPQVGAAQKLRAQYLAKAQ